MPQNLYFQPKFVKQRTDKGLTHKETYCWLMAWDIEGGRLFQGGLPDWRDLHAGGASKSLHFWSLFLLLGRESRAVGSGQQQPEQAHGEMKLRVDVYLSRFLWGDKDRINVSCCIRPWDYGSGQRREKSLVLGVQRAKKKQYLDRRLTTSMVGGRFTMETPGAVGGHSNGKPEVREVAGRNDMMQGMR